SVNCIVKGEEKVLDKLTQMSRIIRNSDRPRASDRTMITTQTSLSLAKSLRPDWHCRHRQRKPNEGKTIQSKIPDRNTGRSYRQWAEDQENSLALRSREKFFLDIPFYRAH